MRLLLRTIVLLNIAALGCKPRATLPKPPPTQPAVTVTQSRYGWYPAWDADASYVAITHLTVPGMFQDKMLGIPIKRWLRIDSNGVQQMVPGPSGGMENADGANEKGGFGYNGGISVENSEIDDDSIQLIVSYTWTTPDQVKGKIDETVTVKVGTPASFQFPGGRTFSVAWRAVAPP